jgi:hypothetical protein
VANYSFFPFYAMRLTLFFSGRQCQQGTDGRIACMHMFIRGEYMFVLLYECLLKYK